MRHLLFAAAMMLLLATAAQARVVTLNATVHNDQGQLVTGSHDVTVKIYASSTGGTPVWGEFHSSVTFTNGQMSISVGSLSSAGIPETYFDGTYYFTIAVSNIGLGDLEPRVGAVGNEATWTGFW